MLARWVGYKNGRTPGIEDSRQLQEKQSCSSTFTDLIVCVIKFDIYKKNKEKKGRCRYFRKAAVAAPTFG